jgi:hypothetical protein
MGRIQRRHFLLAASVSCGWNARAAQPPAGLNQPWFVEKLAGGLRLKHDALVTNPATGDRRRSVMRVVHWAREVVQLTVKYQLNPLRTARALSYVHVAMHDAWVHAAQWPRDAAELAAHRAAALVMEQLYPNETPGQFEAQLVLLAAMLDLPTEYRQDAWAVGEAVGASLINRSLRDGSGRVWPPRNRPPAFEGIWQPSYPLYAANPAEGLAPQWRTWLPRRAQRYQPPTAPRPGSARHLHETREVLQVSRSLTAANKRAAQHWNLDAGSVTPAGVWMQATIDALASEREGTSAELALPVLTAVSVAMFDSFIECWRVKLRDWSERPVTAIRRELDSSFIPLLVTPGFPSYISGHSTVSAAAAAVLSHYWPLRAERFREMAEEASMSRLWGGIHFRGDNHEGLLLGQAVGAEVVDRLRAGGVAS